MVRKILFFTANPEGTDPLRWDEEYRQIKQICGQAKHPEQFDLLNPALAARLKDLQHEMQENKPQIVHFAGHGFKKKTAAVLNPDPPRDISDRPEAEEEGIVFVPTKDEEVPGEAVSGEILAKLFGQYADQLECVILNACFTEDQASAIAKKIQLVIGWTQTVKDEVAIKFSQAFYKALITGCSYQGAYKQACKSLRGNPKPVLYRHGVIYKKKSKKEDEIFQAITGNLKQGLVTLFIGSGINSYGRNNIDWDPKTGYTPTEKEIAKYLAKNCQTNFAQKVKATYLDKQQIEEEVRKNFQILNECPESCPLLNAGSAKKCPLLSTDIMAAAAIQPNLEYLTECIDIILGTPNLYQDINKIFQSNYTPNRVHCLLAELPKVMLDKGYNLPYELIVTTNYDETLEKAFKRERQPFDLVYYMPEEEKFCHRRYEKKGDNQDAELEAQRPQIIDKPNEYKDFYDENKRGNEFKYPVVLKVYGAATNRGQQKHLVLTEDQHLEYEDIREKIPKAITEKLDRHILFLGDDPSDWKLRTILRKIWPSRQFGSKSWAVQLHPEEVEKTIWENSGTKIYNISLEKFTTKLTEWQRDLPKNFEQ